MEKERLGAFTDGVVAVIITIMVLELKPPHEAGADAISHLLPAFLGYVLSFIYVAIYWNNHHHFFHLVREVDGGVLWANMHLLFWLSLIPFATGWMNETGFAQLPVAVYGAVLLASGLAWVVMQGVVMRSQGAGSPLAKALGRDLKGKLSLVFYMIGIGASFWDVRIAGTMYVLVALIWLAPDRRMERYVKGE